MKIICLVSLLAMLTVMGCHEKNSQSNVILTSNSLDTMEIAYLELKLLGQRIFPKNLDSVHNEQVNSAKILLQFASDNYQYLFFNVGTRPKFLSDAYWNSTITGYLEKRLAATPPSNQFLRIDYRDGPYLSAYYNRTDSLIFLTANLDASTYNKSNGLGLCYFSTIDTLFKLENIVVGNSIAQLLRQWNGSEAIPNESEYQIVLMDATTQVSNAWYLNIPGSYSTYSNAVVLTIGNGRIVRIEYFDTEYVDYIFMKRPVYTKDIHLH